LGAGEGGVFERANQDAEDVLRRAAGDYHAKSVSAQRLHEYLGPVPVQGSDL